MLLNRNLKDLRKVEGSYSIDTFKEILGLYDIKSVDPEPYLELFSSSLNIRYTDFKPACKLETYSLFD